MMELSASQLGKLASSVIKPGEVYRMKLTEQEGVKPKNEGDDSRNKYFVVMGTNADGSLVGFVLVNTEINPNVSKKIRDSHYKIKVSDYAFLKKDRYVCCGSLKEITTEKFFEKMQKGSVGCMKEDHLDAIRAIMASSDTVPVALMRMYGII